jgi:ABC-type glycerol-3-phosphate transport system substrate-binding protein
VSFTDIFLYNIDILQAADMDRPPKTRAELLAAARAIAEQEAVHPLALGLSEEDPLALRRELYPWIWAVGGELRQDGVRQNGGQNGDQSGSESVTLSRATTEAIAFFGQLNSEGLLAPGSFEKTRAQRLQEFAGGSVAMLVASSRDLPLLRNSAAAISYSVTAIPQAAQGKNRLGLSGIYAGISSGCTLNDEAWAFLAFTAGRKHLLEEALSAIPGSYPGTFPADYITSDPLYSKTWDIFEAADIVEYHTADPLEEETSRIIREKLEEAFE